MVKLCPGPSDLPGAPVADAVHAGAVVAWGFREKIHGTRVDLASWCISDMQLFDMWKRVDDLIIFIMETIQYSVLLSAGSVGSASSFKSWVSSMSHVMFFAMPPTGFTSEVTSSTGNLEGQVIAKPLWHIGLSFAALNMLCIHANVCGQTYAVCIHVLESFFWVREWQLSNHSICLGLLWGCWWRSFAVN